jgi:hypothetical protein
LIFIYSVVAPDCTFVRRAELERLIADIILTVPQKQKLGWFSEDLEQQITEHLSNSPRKHEEESEESEEEENWDNWDDEDHDDDDDDFGTKKKPQKHSSSGNSDALRKKVGHIVNGVFDRLEILLLQRSQMKIFE